MNGEQLPESSVGTARYTHGHSAAVLSAHSRRGATDSAAYLLPHLSAGMNLLDVGCGPASITADLAEHVAPGRVVALDAAADALEAARATLSERGLSEQVELAGGDVMALPFEDGSFDVVHAHQVLQHLTDPVGALAEMRRLTRPGGIVAVRDAVYSAMTWFPEPAGMEQWRSVYMDTARANGGEPDAGSRLLSRAFGPPSPAVVPQVLLDRVGRVGATSGTGSIGSMLAELLGASQRAVPQALLDSGFGFTAPDAASIWGLGA